MSLVKIYHYDNKDHHLRQKYNVEFTVFQYMWRGMSGYRTVTRISGKDKLHEMGVMRGVTHSDSGILSDVDRKECIDEAIQEYEKIYKQRK